MGHLAISQRVERPILAKQGKLALAQFGDAQGEILNRSEGAQARAASKALAASWRSPRA